MADPEERHEAPLGELPLNRIAQRCAEESQHFFARRDYDPRFCFELFRRAVLTKDGRAWERIFRQYEPLVLGWVRRHSAFPVTGEEAPYFVNRAFEKMWAGVTAEKFAAFPNLKSLLRYLQLCVHSVVIDHTRAAARAEQELELDDRTTAQVVEDITSVEDKTVRQFRQAALWDWLAERLNDEQEQVVMYASFALALKPRQILEEYPKTFGDVQDVYRVKQNVLARLRRDPEMAQRFGIQG